LISYLFRKEFAQPVAAGKDELVRFDRGSIRKAYSTQMAAFKFINNDSRLPILTTFTNEPLDDSLTRGARSQVSALPFKQSPLDLFQIDLRPALLQFTRRKFLERNSRIAQLRQRSPLEAVVSIGKP